MTREEALERAGVMLADYLRQRGIDAQPGKDFCCVNPAHNDSNPSMGLYVSEKTGRQRCKCRGCGADYSVFDLVAQDYGLSENRDILEKTYSVLGLRIDASVGNKPAQVAPDKSQENQMPQSPKASQEPQKPLKDYSEELARFHGDILKTDYPRLRGLSQKTIERFNLGFKADFFFSQGRGNHPALIIPTSKNSFVVRNTEPNAEKKNRYDSRGPKTPLNLEALERATTPIFLVEGELDALSIIEAGGEAISLGGIECKKVVAAITEKKPTQPLILALDNDNRGMAAAMELRDALREAGFNSYQMELYGASKDANEALLADRDEFTRTISSIRGEGDIYRATNSSGSQLQGFLDRVKASKKAPCFSTGFIEVDSLLDGGLYAGLYVLGAISSLGKTTMSLQIMDAIASAGHDVLIFSLEMARDEIMAKSISRHSYLIAMERYGKSSAAKTTRGILAGAKWEYYNQDELETIQAAVEAYGDYASHIFIHEGVGDIGVAQIRETVERHIQITGNRPVVLIDYLQILAPTMDRGTDKQNTDKNILELKRLSRDCNIPILGISSFNRDNYTEPVNMASFKESGAIEYSADVLLGIQYRGMDYTESESEKEHKNRVRNLLDSISADAKAGKFIPVEVKILKNRNGSKGSCELRFSPMFNYFRTKNSAEKMQQCAFELRSLSKDEYAEELPFSTGPSSPEAQKPTKRAERRARLDAAFQRVKNSEGYATLKDMAAELDSTTKTVKSHLDEYGGYIVDKKNVYPEGYQMPVESPGAAEPEPSQDGFELSWDEGLPMSEGNY